MRYFIHVYGFEILRVHARCPIISTMSATLPSAITAGGRLTGTNGMSTI